MCPLSGCGYSAGGFCAVYLGTLESGCVSPKWVISSIGFDLARTSFCFREGLFL